MWGQVKYYDHSQSLWGLVSRGVNICPKSNLKVIWSVDVKIRISKYWGEGWSPWHPQTHFLLLNSKVITRREESIAHNPRQPLNPLFTLFLSSCRYRSLAWAHYGESFVLPAPKKNNKKTLRQVSCVKVLWVWDVCINVLYLMCFLVVMLWSKNLSIWVVLWKDWQQN